jgi:16S rRNA processing protein RimM
VAARSDLVCVGAIAGAFGVRGEVRVKPFTAEPETVFALGPLLDEEGAVRLTVTEWRPINDGYAAFAKEIPTREAAMAMKSTRLFVPRASLPAADEDEFYHADLVGLRVVGLDGAPLGEVRGVQNFGASDLIEIWRTPGVRQPWMLPFTEAAVPHVDLAKGEVVVDPPEGMGPEESEAGDNAEAHNPEADGEEPRD